MTQLPGARALSGWTLGICLLLVSVFPSITAHSAQDLLFLVVDRSASIGKAGLKEPIEKSVLEYVRSLPEGTEVRLKLFSSHAKSIIAELNTTVLFIHNNINA